MKKTNLLDWHSGKWYEVCTLSTTDQNEKPDVVAKFTSEFLAKWFFDNMPNQSVFTEIILR